MIDAVDTAGAVWEGRRVMRALPGLARAVVITLSLAAASCGLSAPTPPEQEPERDSSSVTPTNTRPPAAPGASPTATPGPTDPSPSPSASPTPDASGCGDPLPPPITQIVVKVHMKGDDAWTLDSTPLVHDFAYCTEVGFVNRADCPVRPEGNPERSACELYAVGRAKDNNRPGPTWYFKGGFCTGRPSGCQNHPENQYLLRTYVSGTFKACARNDVCGEVEVGR